MLSTAIESRYNNCIKMPALSDLELLSLPQSDRDQSSLNYHFTPSHTTRTQFAKSNLLFIVTAYMKEFIHVLKTAKVSGHHYWYVTFRHKNCSWHLVASKSEVDCFDVKERQEQRCTVYQLQRFSSRYTDFPT